MSLMRQFASFLESLKSADNSNSKIEKDELELDGVGLISSGKESQFLSKNRKITCDSNTGISNSNAEGIFQGSTKTMNEYDDLIESSNTGESCTSNSDDEEFWLDDIGLTTSSTISNNYTVPDESKDEILPSKNSYKREFEDGNFSDIHVKELIDEDLVHVSSIEGFSVDSDQFELDLTDDPIDYNLCDQESDDLDSFNEEDFEFLSNEFFEEPNEEIAQEILVDDELILSKETLIESIINLLPIHDTLTSKKIQFASNTLRHLETRKCGQIHDILSEKEVDLSSCIEAFNVIESWHEVTNYGRYYYNKYEQIETQKKLFNLEYSISFKMAVDIVEFCKDEVSTEDFFNNTYALWVRGFNHGRNTYIGFLKSVLYSHSTPLDLLHSYSFIEYLKPNTELDDTTILTLLKKYEEYNDYKI